VRSSLYSCHTCFSLCQLHRSLVSLSCRYLLFTPCSVYSALSLPTRVQRTMSLCGSCVAFSDKCQAPCFSRLSLRLFLIGWTTVTASWSELEQHIIQLLQSVQNAAARLIFGICCSEHITDASFVFVCSDLLRCSQQFT